MIKDKDENVKLMRKILSERPQRTKPASMIVQQMPFDRGLSNTNHIRNLQNELKDAKMRISLLEQNLDSLTKLVHALHPQKFIPDKKEWP